MSIQQEQKQKQTSVKMARETNKNKFYSSQCGFNGELAVLAPFSIHQIILLLLTILMCMSKDNYV